LLDEVHRQANDKATKLESLRHYLAENYEKVKPHIPDIAKFLKHWALDLKDVHISKTGFDEEDMKEGDQFHMSGTLTTSRKLYSDSKLGEKGAEAFVSKIRNEFRAQFGDKGFLGLSINKYSLMESRSRFGVLPTPGKKDVLFDIWFKG
jgi:hypothetical protein